MSDYKFKIMNDYALVVEFELSVISTLPKEEHVFFAPRNEQWYYDNLRDGDYVVGAFDGETLIGKGIVMQLEAQEMDTESLRQFARKYAPDIKAADLCGDFVDHKYAGLGLQKNLIDYRAVLMNEKELPYMIAVTLTQNFKSIASYLKAGFILEGTGLSDAEGNPNLYFMCKKLDGSYVGSCTTSQDEIQIAANDEMKVVEKIKQGWRGVALNKPTGSLSSPMMTLVK